MVGLLTTFCFETDGCWAPRITFSSGRTTVKQAQLYQSAPGKVTIRVARGEGYSESDRERVGGWGPETRFPSSTLTKYSDPRQAIQGVIS